MTQEEMKHKLQESAFDVFVKVQPFYKSTSESESDLQEAKSSAKKLIEKIDEYLESQKPKFKVGDYVTNTSDDDPFICKIEKFKGNGISGKWHCVSKKYFSELVILPVSNSRLSTPEEIAEYESALQFHKHGRKPFEVKGGDLLENKFGRYIANGYSFSKEDFMVGSNTLLKTAEEVNEWLDNK